MVHCLAVCEFCTVGARSQAILGWFVVRFFGSFLAAFGLVNIIFMFSADWKSARYFLFKIFDLRFCDFFDFGSLFRRTILKNKFSTQKSVSNNFLRYLKYMLSAGLARSTPLRKIFPGFQKNTKICGFRRFSRIFMDLEDFYSNLMMFEDVY